MQAKNNSTKPRVIIIAGPNGAGKTTFAREFLGAEGKYPNFFNADLIAAGISPINPEKANIKAMRLMVQQIRECFSQREDFAVESTLSGKSYAKLIKQWKAADYNVKIVFLKLDSPDMAVARVKQRVSLGGHNIPEDVIRRRYTKGWSNFQEIYKPLANSWRLYNAMKMPPELLESNSS